MHSRTGGKLLQKGVVCTLPSLCTLYPVFLSDNMSKIYSAISQSGY